MMASGREKREKAGEKLKDIIESLKGPKATKTDIETLNDSATAVTICKDFPDFSELHAIMSFIFSPLLVPSVANEFAFGGCCSFFKSSFSSSIFLRSSTFLRSVFKRCNSLSKSCISSAPFCFLLHFNFYKHRKHI
jgi:hypothetical protein